jgi:putative ABC transport system ATP-binding protein
MESIISIKNVSVRRDLSGSHKEILSNINFEFDRSILVVQGPSGAGKTSLIRLINGLSSPSKGHISVLGKPIQDWIPQGLRQKVGYVCQQAIALTDTARGDLNLSCELAGVDYDATWVKAGFRALGLSDSMLQQSVAQFSVGERQRFSLLRALCAKPKILLLDEPSSALDEARANDVHTFLLNLMEEGLRLVLIEHRPSLLDLYPKDRIQTLRLENGRRVST